MLDFLRKRDHRATLEPGGETVLVKAGEKLLTAALEAGLDWPHDCRVGSCGTCRCLLRSGKVKRLTDFSYTLPPEEIARGMILACQSRLQSDVTVEIALGTGSATTERHPGRIARQVALTYDILEVHVATATGAFGSARAGQYADVARAGLAEPRSYSFARRPGTAGDGMLSFFIRHVPGGEFTDWLFGADRTGAELGLAGPFGAFHYRPAAGRMICVAGGSGLAPVYALLEDALRNRVARDCVLLFGARTQADLYYQDELAALARAWPGSFELRPVLSLEPADSDWQGARGLVTDVLPQIAGPGFTAGDQAYLCGPPPMVDAGIAALAALGMAADAIYCDRFLDASTQPGGRAAMAV
jgi:CDP-4-dehydro-6-deoxyglucose reductase